MNIGKFKNHRMLWFGAVLGAIIATASMLLIDPIPVNNGLGWDGKIRYEIIQAWAEGRVGNGSIPYHFMRMGAFIPAVVYKAISHSDQATYIFFRLLQVLLMFLATQLLLFSGLSVSNGQEIRPKVSAALFVLCFALCHAVFTMPSLYPVLTDHTAIFISSFSLYAWSNIRKDHFRNLILFLLSVFGFFVMPMLSLVPMALLALPLRNETLPTSETSSHKAIDTKKLSYSYILLSIAFAFFTARHLFRYSRRLSEELLLSGIGETSPAIIELRPVSAACFAFIALVFSFTLAYSSFHSIKLIKWPGVFLALASVVVAAPVLYFFPDWKSGMGGPQFILNITMQGLRAPGNSIAALFSYYGPIGLLGMTSLLISVFHKEFAVRKYSALFVIASLFGGLSLLGNETRQFLCVLPVLVFLTIVVFNKNLVMAAISLTFTILLIPVGYPISNHLAMAISSQNNFMHPSWQAYFGRQGPWMSTPSLLLFGAMAFLYTIAVAMYFIILWKRVSLNLETNGHE